MLKWLFKWGLRLFLLCVVLLVAFFLSLDSILRLIIEHNIRQQCGLTAEIGKFHLGLTDPVVDIKNLKLYNPPRFGGTPFLNIPEIHVEYDPAALQRREIHLTLLRFNLGELDLVKNLAGETNLFSLGLAVPEKKAGPGSSEAAMAEFKAQTGFGFKAIDVLNVSVGDFKYIDLQNSGNNREQKIGVENCVITNVTSTADLAGLGLLVGLRSGDFFKPLAGPGGSGTGQSAMDLFKLLGH